MQKCCIFCQDGSARLYQIVGRTYRGEKQTDMLARHALSPAERLECTRALSVNYWIKMLL